MSLGPGLNIICGANNSGKTALIEALDPRTQGKPHRSQTTIPNPGGYPNPISQLDVEFTVFRDELRELLQSHPSMSFNFALPNDADAFASRIGYRSGVQEYIKRLFEEVVAQDYLRFRVTKRMPLGGTISWTAQSLPSYGLYDLRKAGTGPRFALFQLGHNAVPTRFEASGDTSETDLGVTLAPQFADKVYRFYAERLNVASSPMGITTHLLPDARNLPEVLNALQPYKQKFQKFNELVHEILPQVRGISLHPIDGQRIEIRVSSLDALADREDLSLSLAECGTGIGQVLGILYVVMFSKPSQVIVIDEPQNFLHPGAVRKLIQVLKENPTHQFIIATHSPTLISAAEPTSIVLCKWQDQHSSLEQLNPQKGDVQRFLVEVGARLSDVFGADNILWVEGRTEEQCFPKIVRAIAGGVGLQGSAILGVRSTDELESRDAEKILDIYNRLSGQQSLMPPAIGFIFDRECRTDAEQQELVKRSRNLLRFLPRRMFENYLLNCEGIASLLNRWDETRGTPLQADAVASQLEQLRKDPTYFKKLDFDSASKDWLANINGANVLNRLFNDLTETRVSYAKTDHAVQLTEWVLANAPADLREVSDILANRLGLDHN